MEISINKLGKWWWRLSDESRMAYSILIMLSLTVIAMLFASLFSRFSC